MSSAHHRAPSSDRHPAAEAEVRSRWQGHLGLTEYHFEADTRLPDHGHPWASVNWMIGGSLTERIGRHSEEIEPGTTVFRPAGTDHRVHIGPKGGRALHLEVGPSWIDRAEELGPFDSFVDRSRGPLHRIAARLHAELTAWDDCSGAIVEGLALELIGSAARARSRSEFRPDWLGRVLELLRDSDRHLTAREIAAQLDLDPVRLARAFRRFEGESVGCYGLRRRLDRAHRMVLSTDSSITDIAHGLGFADHAHLTRRFKRQFGVPPSALRRSAAN